MQDRVASLRTLWDEGLSTAEIGRRLGVSKNAVVSKAHRIALSPRPIHRTNTAPKDRAEAVQPFTQAPLPHISRGGPAPAPLQTTARLSSDAAPHVFENEGPVE